jgi:hypothetical protein
VLVRKHGLNELLATAEPTVDLKLMMDWLWPGKGSAIELMDVNDPKFALRIFADPKIEGRIAMGIAGTVRNGPIEWLIHDKQIGIPRPHHFSLSAGRPFPDGPLIVVMPRRSLNIR